MARPAFIHKLLSTSSAVLLVACSSSKGASSSGDACTCDVSLNGASQTLMCGESLCVNGETFVCSSSGATTGGACTSSSSSDDGGATSDSALCAMMFACGNAGLTCEAATQYCVVSAGGAVCESVHTDPVTACAFMSQSLGCNCQGDCTSGVICQ